MHLRYQRKQEPMTQDNIHYQNKIVNKIKGLMRSGQKSYSYSENLNIYDLHMLTVLNEMLLSEPNLVPRGFF